jgi:hypothetical protein
MVEKTFVIIEISKSHLPIIQFVMERLDGYDNSKSFFESKSDDPSVVVYTVKYNKRLGYRDGRRLKKSVKQQEGKITSMFNADKKPMMSSQSKKKLKDNLIVSAIVFFSSLVGTNYIASPIELIRGIVLSSIPTIIAFLGGLLIICRKY